MICILIGEKVFVAIILLSYLANLPFHFLRPPLLHYFFALYIHSYLASLDPTSSLHPLKPYKLIGKSAI